MRFYFLAFIIGASLLCSQKVDGKRFENINHLKSSSRLNKRVYDTANTLVNVAGKNGVYSPTYQNQAQAGGASPATGGGAAPAKAAPASTTTTPPSGPFGAIPTTLTLPTVPPPALPVPALPAPALPALPAGFLPKSLPALPALPGADSLVLPGLPTVPPLAAPALPALALPPIAGLPLPGLGGED
ncbi:hypothetical protein K501DRAFT_277060 [Backusella circina FSU 941]|nr:hypothetical protein K501DRAFT_277060 [Backusella circina FSU 941]